jgi:hypothetical protein
LPSLDASGIAEYIRFDCCPRYFKLRFEGNSEEKSRRWPEAFKPLSPLLYGAGRELEAAKVAELKNKASEYQDLNYIDTQVTPWTESWPKSLKVLKSLVEKQLNNCSGDTKPILVYQAPLKGYIGLWDIKGKAD